MAISYVSMAVLNVLLLELLIGGTVLLVLTFSPILDQGLRSTAQQAAQLYALEAQLQGAGVALPPRITFQPGQPYSLAPPSQPGQNSSLTPQITYIPPGQHADHVTAFGLLVGLDGRVIASSYPDRYPPSHSVAQLLPEQMPIIRGALAGQKDTVQVVDTPAHTAFAASPVWNRSETRPIGAIFVHITWDISGGDLFWNAAKIWLISGLFWLIIMGPLGTSFGMLSTRGLVRRIHRLVEATAKFARGDYTQRVSAKKRDEVGQLEAQFNQMAEQLVESIKQSQALAEQNARIEERARIEQEMHTAQLIQRSLLPKELPDLPGWKITTYYQPAREVGGDLYDFLILKDGRLGLVIGDVADKGVPAAMMMASTRSMLQAAVQVTYLPGEALARVNDLLYADIPARMFVTCFYAILDPQSGKLVYANAGHDLPYQRQDGATVELQARGMPLGLMPDMLYEEQELVIPPGASVLLYSDGLIEAHNRAREMFGFPRLRSLLEKPDTQMPLIDYLLSELRSFTSEHWEQEDDITLVLLERLSGSSESNEQPAPNEINLEWSIESQPGNEQKAMEWIEAVVYSLDISAERLANLKTAVAEAVMNAMEHGNHYQPDKMVTLQVRTSEAALTVRILDQGEGEPLPDVEAIATPDLTTKLAGLQTPRGWGLFLMKSLVDELHISREGPHQVIELVLFQQRETERKALSSPTSAAED